MTRYPDTNHMGTLLFEFNADPVILVDARTFNILDCNRAMIDIYGYTAEELCKMTLPMLHPAHNPDDVHQYSASEKSGPLPVCTHVTKSGKTILVEPNTSKTSFEKTDILVITLRIVTRRHLTEEELKKRYRLQQSLLKISEASRESDLNILYQTIHQQVDQFMPAKNFYIALLEDYDQCRYSFLYYCDQKNEDELYQGCSICLPGSFTDWVAKNGPLLLDFQTVEKIVLGQIHIRVDIEQIGKRASSWMGVQLTGRSKKPMGVLVVQDYTNPNAYTEADLNLLKIASETVGSAIQYAQAEKALARSEEMFRTLVETSAVGINEVDIHENIIYSNRVFANMLGYSNPGDIIGRSLKEFTSPRVFEDLVRRTRIERIKGISGSYESQFIDRYGHPIEVIISANPSGFHGEKLAKIMSVVVDITERKKAEKDKIQAQKHAAEQEKQALVGQVAGKMAHDFNNILGIILGNAELALMEYTDEKLKNTFEIILNQAERGRNLTRNLVAFARDHEPRQEFFDINEKIELALSLLRKDLGTITSARELTPDMPRLLADPGMIEHALINLVQNAIHALSRTQNPTLTLRTYYAAGYIYIEVADNGCGIPKEHWDDIYTPSFTLKGSRDRTRSYQPNIKGTGYGMANVKLYVEKHNGTIFFKSRVNQGTTFVIKLPVTRKTLTEKEIIEIKKTRVVTKKRILLVEDEPAISEIQKKILTQSPCRHFVDLSASGKTAGRLMEENAYDLVSLDYVLSGDLNGMDVYHEIRRLDQRIPVLFISGNIEFLESIKTLKQKDPYIEHLSKPCNNKTYIDTINRMLLEAESDDG